jgi:MoxR-like ATPase
MSAETAIAVSSKATELEKALRRVIRGKDDVVRLALVSIFARGHLLIEGVPGVGKTTLGQALARAIDCTFQQRYASLRRSRDFRLFSDRAGI